MATTKFPKFSQGLANDPTTRRIWFGIATAHDFESHDGMTEESYTKRFCSHFGQLAIIFLWTSGNLFHVAWQGNFEQWGQNPIRPIAHAIWDPHFGQPAVEVYRGGASGPVNSDIWGISVVVYYWYALKPRFIHWFSLLALGATAFLFAGWLLQPKFQPGLSWFKMQNRV
jgi:photosystem I P700 chlorophyll a apoprotein A2